MLHETSSTSRWQNLHVSALLLCSEFLWYGTGHWYCGRVALLQKHQKESLSLLEFLRFLTAIAYGRMFKYICRACMKCRASTEPLLLPRHRSCSQHLCSYRTQKSLCANNTWIGLSQFAGHRKEWFLWRLPLRTYWKIIRLFILTLSVSFLVDFQLIYFRIESNTLSEVSTDSRKASGPIMKAHRNGESTAPVPLVTDPCCFNIMLPLFYFNLSYFGFLIKLFSLG